MGLRRGGGLDKHSPPFVRTSLSLVPHTPSYLCHIRVASEEVLHLHQRLRGQGLTARVQEQQQTLNYAAHIRHLKCGKVWKAARVRGSRDGKVWGEELDH